MRITKVLFAVAIASLMIGYSTDPPHSPVAHLEAEEDYYFEDICDMARASDAVIEAAAVSAQPGRILGDADDPHSALQVREVGLHISDFLRGSLPSLDILLEEIGWDGEGNPLALEGQIPSHVGDVGLYFVVAKNDPTPQPYYRTINSQGKFFYKGGAIVGTIANDPLVRQIEEMTIAEVRGIVGRNVDDQHLEQQECP